MSGNRGQVRKDGYEEFDKKSSPSREGFLEVPSRVHV